MKTPSRKSNRQQAIMFQPRRRANGWFRSSVDNRGACRTRQERNDGMLGKSRAPRVARLPREFSRAGAPDAVEGSPDYPNFGRYRRQLL